ncbi:MAG TPA: pirin family protein, partial [Micromonosporaceae bacterium]
MSNLEPGVVAGDATETLAGGTAVVATTPVWELLSGREVVLGGPRGLPVLRTLPNKDRRMVGAWCFVDHYRTAPDSSAAQDGAATPVDAAAVDQRPTMKVAPHPHTGLQTVTWLVDGEVRHRDTLGSDQLIRPGQLNLMTAGRGIAHAEDSIGRPGAPLHGVQLWVALPDESRQVPPDFAHHANLPLRTEDGVELRVIMGELDGATSPARTYSDLVGAEVALRPSASTRLQLRPDFEYAALVLVGSVRVGSVRVGEVALDPGPLLYLGCGREELS